MATLRAPAALFGLLLLGSPLGCEQETTEPDAGLSPFYMSGVESEKSKLYNLIGRWYPESEINRLRDPSLTPEEWCAREPSRIFVHQDQVEVFCSQQAPRRAAIARIKTSTQAGELLLMLRANKDAPLKRLRFEANGPSAVIAGSPCFGGKPTMHRRFPEYEILTRQILGGRRCAQVIDPSASPEIGIPEPPEK